ncbi:hypothetical protein BGX38DRAFT_1218618 [Terfezia claveryi]|nr:hypothetical protein BGX38DRAFT_1218618 [Terfezia claveryi]
MEPVTASTMFVYTICESTTSDNLIHLKGRFSPHCHSFDYASTEPPLNIAEVCGATSPITSRRQSSKLIAQGEFQTHLDRHSKPTRTEGTINTTLPKYLQAPIPLPPFRWPNYLFLYTLNIHFLAPVQSSQKLFCIAFLSPFILDLVQALSSDLLS